MANVTLSEWQYETGCYSNDNYIVVEGTADCPVGSKVYLVLDADAIIGPGKVIKAGTAYDLGATVDANGNFAADIELGAAGIPAILYGKDGRFKVRIEKPDGTLCSESATFQMTDGGER